ncbi:MAG: PD-(D/E)XK nuclease family protein [Anaerolineales bacterium]|nr:PD-(D/E)XK nuclease family protein [Anaerolineales bacterium]
MSEAFKISAKSLGELALPTFCPRCFWLRLHASKLPFQIFPGIFSSIDSYSKKVTRAYYQQHGDLLRWFSDFGLSGAPVKAPHHSRFNYLDPASNVTLSGAPDEILALDDGTYAILDYKTSRFTPAQDALFPMYETQLNAYACIGERNGLAPVSRLALVYYEPLTDLSEGQVDLLIQAEGFLMPFNGYMKPVALQPGLVERLLLQAREIHNHPMAPAGREGCPDCRALDDLLALLRR